MDGISLIEAYENMAIAYSENFLDEAALSHFIKAYQLSLESATFQACLKLQGYFYFILLP
jgi:hypothetical protein